MANFTKGSIEFLTISVEFCKFIENIPEDKTDTISKISKLLPLIYLKASMVETGEMIYDEEPEKFVDENDYNLILKSLCQLFGENDQYLTAIHPEIALSDSVIAASISEDIADVYQSLKDFVSAAQLGNDDILNDSLIVCMNDFRAFWGTRLLSATLAIHQVICTSFNKEEEPDTNPIPLPL